MLRILVLGATSGEARGDPLTSAEMPGSCHPRFDGAFESQRGFRRSIRSPPWSVPLGFERSRPSRRSGRRRISSKDRCCSCDSGSEGLVSDVRYSEAKAGVGMGSGRLLRVCFSAEHFVSGLRPWLWTCLLSTHCHHAPPNRRRIHGCAACYADLAFGFRLICLSRLRTGAVSAFTPTPPAE